MTSDDTALDPRQACAVESAARSNPDMKIIVLHTRPDVSLNVRLPNVKLEYLDPETMFAGTPLKSWYHSDAFDSSPHKRIHLSDGLRAVLMWKFGGIYMDLDFICLRSFRGLGRNFLGFESEKRVNSALMRFSPAHPFIAEVLESVRRHYDPKTIPGAGPYIFTKVFLEHCPGDNGTNWKDAVTCDDITAYPVPYFYPVPHESDTKLFDPGDLGEVLARLDETFAIHFWNALTNGIEARVEDEVALTVLARKHCPSVFGTVDDAFGKSFPSLSPHRRKSSVLG